MACELAQEREVDFFESFTFANRLQPERVLTWITTVRTLCPASAPPCVRVPLNVTRLPNTTFAGDAPSVSAIAAGCVVYSTLKELVRHL